MIEILWYQVVHLHHRNNRRNLSNGLDLQLFRILQLIGSSTINFTKDHYTEKCQLSLALRLAGQSNSLDRNFHYCLWGEIPKWYGYSNPYWDHGMREGGMSTTFYPRTNPLTCNFSVRNTLLVHVKFQISILCGVLKTTNHQKLTQRTIAPLDARSHPKGVPPI